jgi:hypothetical protein
MYHPARYASKEVLTWLKPIEIVDVGKKDHELQVNSPTPKLGFHIVSLGCFHIVFLGCPWSALLCGSGDGVVDTKLQLV